VKREFVSIRGFSSGSKNDPIGARQKGKSLSGREEFVLKRLDDVIDKLFSNAFEPIEEIDIVVNDRIIFVFGDLLVEVVVFEVRRANDFVVYAFVGVESEVERKKGFDVLDGREGFSDARTLRVAPDTIGGEEEEKLFSFSVFEELVLLVEFDGGHFAFLYNGKRNL